MAEERVRDVAALLKVRRWSAAYYLAGYAVECGLKACIVAHVQRHIEVIFRERRFSERCWTHDFDELLRLAELKALQEADIAADPTLHRSWLLVKNWKETARYERKTRIEAEGLYQGSGRERLPGFVLRHRSAARADRTGRSRTASTRCGLL